MYPVYPELGESRGQGLGQVKSQGKGHTMDLTGVSAADRTKEASGDVGGRPGPDSNRVRSEIISETTRNVPWSGLKRCHLAECRGPDLKIKIDQINY